MRSLTKIVLLVSIPLIIAGSYEVGRIHQQYVDQSAVTHSNRVADQSGELDKRIGALLVGKRMAEESPTTYKLAKKVDGTLLDFYPENKFLDAPDKNFERVMGYEEIVGQIGELEKESDMKVVQNNLYTAIEYLSSHQAEKQKFGRESLAQILYDYPQYSSEIDGRVKGLIQVYSRGIKSKETAMYKVYQDLASQIIDPK